VLGELGKQSTVTTSYEHLKVVRTFVTNNWQVSMPPT